MNQSRREIIERAVLEAIANDFESLPTIICDVHGWCPEMDVTESEVLDALQALLVAREAAVHEFVNGQFRATAFDPERRNEIYLYATKSGRTKANL